DGILLNFGTLAPKSVKKPVTRNPVQNRPVEKANYVETAETAESTESAPATGLAPGTKVLHGKAQIVSSLFSSNPRIPTSFQKKSSHKEGSASNAPMVDASSFTGIGIESDLAEHLSNKLNVTTPTNVQAKAIPILLGPASNQHKEDVDVVVQAQTGSGKTLTYLLPIVNRLIAASTAPKDAIKQQEQPFGDRTVGTVAIILTPTRELAQQVLGVLTTLVNLPRPKDENLRRLHWIVPGIVIGGDSKAKEKARLRKGINVLVSTPGRLLDHLENTKSFDISHLKWLVLDEADRLLDLGFEESLKKIMSIIDQRTKSEGSSKFKQLMGNKYWPTKRQTVLCSATLRDDVKELAGWSLVKPAFVSGTDAKQDASKMFERNEDEEMKFSTPNQLKQTHIIIPAKLRLITLLALLRSCFYDRQQRKSLNSKVIVFFSCCDSVDFHYDLFSNAGKPILDEDSDDDEQDESKIMKNALSKIVGKQKVVRKNKKTEEKSKEPEPVSQISTLLLDKLVFRLHGDLNQQVRSQTFAEFSKAKAGVFEMEYLDILKAQDLLPDPISMETILKHLANQGDYQMPAQELQNTMENYVLSDESHIELARKAFWSTCRAYATHPASEKHIFHVKRLHLGHLAKSFALREAPSNIHEKSKGKKKKEARNERMPGLKKFEGKEKPTGPRKNNNNPLKRNFDHASEFAIASASTMMEGPTTKKKKKNNNKK
ncbi:ATP-dependent RNA helicase dbp7, partial [Rhizopus stolonifer]